MVIDYRHYGRPAPAPAPVSFWHRPRRMNAVANLLYVLAGVLAGYAGMMWFLAQPYLSLQEVVVHRKLEHVTREQIEGVVRLCVRQRNFLLTDVDALRTAFERLPGVKQASVRRRWPGVLDVHLQEYRPVAYWTQQGSEDTQMLDEHGTLFPGASNEALPMLPGRCRAGCLAALYPLQRPTCGGGFAHPSPVAVRPPRLAGRIGQRHDAGTGSGTG